MSNYHDEMGWEPLADGAAPDHVSQFAQYLRDIGQWDLLGVHEQTPPPASKTAIDNLKEIKITENETSKDCPVCLKKFKVDDIAKCLPCKHTFHDSCILAWLDKMRAKVTRVSEFCGITLKGGKEIMRNEEN
ncbi:E3 ubiquitin-protein ligase RNF181 isoform X2 [Aphidius gifuensis]|uniref:E3 ubiquitin-protein ligase RNF181 isoform X2 n=1 Tax=Aphidius gifuensis TaxID=684658 RepID=UPI001CDCF73E|nr:E3 ubiquitin-protein ligase RNF181 isoform X2 [Aphidius gifuensis]